MQSKIRSPWLLSAVAFLSALMVYPFLDMIGVSLTQAKSRIGEISLFIVIMLGIAFIVENILSFFLLKFFPKKIKVQ